MSKLLSLLGTLSLLSSLSFGEAITSGEEWVARYNGPGNSYDEATAIVVDKSGNIYVTGTSWGSGTSYDYATIKYNPTGVEQWVQRYNGPDNSYDEATAITVDGEYVYVTGGSMNLAIYYDCATVKYDSSGNLLWTKRYDGTANDNDYAYAIAVDKSGCVYITGYSTVSDTTWWNALTVKYTPSGVEQWSQTYITNDHDYSIAIAIDDSGNVYVAGSSGDIYTSALDYITIKYSPAGIEQWVQRYSGPADDHDEARAIALDDSGNVYVTGGSVGTGSGYDYATIKYNSSGDLLWVRRYNGPGNGADWANAIAVDNSGNVYVTGYSADSLTDCDYATVKYNSSGEKQWVARYNGPGNRHDEATAITVDENGFVYVTGWSYGSGTGTDYATIKYDSLGVEQWVKRYNGSANGNDYAYAIAHHGDYIYVTGKSYGTGTNYDYVTVKYSCVGLEEKKLSHDSLEFRMAEKVIHLFVPDAMEIDIKLYDLCGRLRNVIYEGTLNRGKHTFTPTIRASGVYFVVLKTELTRLTRKFVLLK